MNFLALITLVLLVVLATTTIVYVRRIIKLHQFLSVQQAPLFGRHYRSPAEIYADFSFISRLFDKPDEIELLDGEVKDHVLAVRRLFVLQLIIGGFVFIGFMLNAVVNG